MAGEPAGASSPAALAAPVPNPRKTGFVSASSLWDCPEPAPAAAKRKLPAADEHRGGEAAPKPGQSIASSSSGKKARAVPAGTDKSQTKLSFLAVTKQ